MKIGNLEIHGVIYKIINKINNKIYIGQTIQEGGFDVRYHGNLERNTHNKHLKMSIHKYGIENFEVIKVLDIAFSQEELDIREDLYIKIYNTTNPKYGYNNREGGRQGKVNIEGKNNMSKAQGGNRIICTTTNKIFDNAVEAGKYYKVSACRIRQCCKGNAIHAGVDENGQKLKWKYCIGYQKIICITTNEIFQSISEGAKKYNIKSTSNITDCCKGRVMSAGRHPDTNKKLEWMYYEDYLNKIA
jgi:hypothetical protein